MFFVHCRNRVFVSENGVEGNYTDYTGDKWLGIPWTEFDLGALRVGNTAAFEENGTMYIATTRLQTNTNLQDRRRYFFIYRLDDSWTHLVEDEEERIVAWWEFPNFESPYITTGDGWYYLFGSQTNGWGESRTRYRRARSLAELATASDSFVYMHPADNNNIKSMGTQFSFFHKLDNDRWIFGGRRHPIEDPDQFDSKYGKLVMAPATFINGIPNAFWKYSFDWETYDFDNSDFDSHSHYGYGHKPCPTCPTPVPTGNPSLNQIITPSTVLPTLSSSRPSSYEPSIIPSPVPFSLSPISPPTPQPSEATGRKSFLPSSALSSSSPYLPLTARPSLAVAETPSRTSTSNSERQVSNFAGLLGLGLNLLAIL